MEAYRDSTQNIENRVKDLLSRMTLDEKIAQLGSYFASALLEDGRFSEDKAGGLIKHGIGEISGAGRSSALPPGEMAVWINELQRYLLENTRLGIPAIVHEECLNGFRAKGATIFPQNIGLASTWDPDLIGEITEVVRRQMTATGVRQGLAPVVDVARDPRWGRTEETFGEDPYLVGRMAVAYVKGLQGDDIKHGVVATLKHFAGHGLPEGGLNCSPTHIPPRLFREVYLYPFEKAIKEGGALSIMNAYHEIDGIPCGASEELLTGILRNEWGFQGIVVSDYRSISQLVSIHRIGQENADAARLAITAGIDIELPQTDCYSGPLKKMVENGTVPEALVDRAVSRILGIKFRLGLFENPYTKPKEAAKIIDTPEQRELSLRAARESIILLKNDKNLLPLDKNIRRIAVIGPSADSQRNLMGDYTYPAGSGYELEIDEENKKVNVKWKDGDSQPDRVDTPAVISILEGISEKVSGKTEVLYAKGCEITTSSRDGFDEAIKAAQSADVALLVVGGKSGMLPDCTCGELRDRVELGLPGIQEDLVKEISETGTPVVVILVNGRPYTLGWIAEKAAAVIEAWMPGEEGGRAVADVLFGDYNPGGKLPISFPDKTGQIPVYYGHKPSGRRSSLWGDYVDGSAGPLYEFGYGLSYTTFEFSDLSIKPDKVRSAGTVLIKVKVKNTGSMAGNEVVQLYINDIIASVTRPVKELKGFERIHLQPGEERIVEFRLPAGLLSFYNKKMEYIVEPGVFKVMVGRSSRDILLEGEFTVEG
jgi:beta-glucosidase